jgi:hypothetical protein
MGSRRTLSVIHGRKLRIRRSSRAVFFPEITLPEATADADPDATAARKRATADRRGGIGSRVAPRIGPNGAPPGTVADPGHATGAGNGPTAIGATPTGTTAGADRGTPPEPGTRRPLSVLRR